MLDYVITFFAIFALDLVYTYYLKCVQNDDAIGASLWAVACYLLGGVAVIQYTTNYMMLIPACLGAIFGTYTGMRIKSKKENGE